MRVLLREEPVGSVAQDRLDGVGGAQLGRHSGYLRRVGIPAGAGMITEGREAGVPTRYAAGISQPKHSARPLACRLQPGEMWGSRPTPFIA